MPNLDDVARSMPSGSSSLSTFMAELKDLKDFCNQQFERYQAISERDGKRIMMLMNMDENGQPTVKGGESHGRIWVFPITYTFGKKGIVRSVYETRLAKDLRDGSYACSIGRYRVGRWDISMDDDAGEFEHNELKYFRSCDAMMEYFVKGLRHEKIIDYAP